MSPVERGPRIAGRPTQTTGTPLALEHGDHVVDALLVEFAPFVGVKLVAGARPRALRFGAPAAAPASALAASPAFWSAAGAGAEFGAAGLAASPPGGVAAPRGARSRIEMRSLRPSMTTMALGFSLASMSLAACHQSRFSLRQS